MQKANIIICRDGYSCTTVEVTREALSNGKFKMTYNSRGWVKPMSQGEFSSMLIKEGLEVHPKKPRFKTAED